MKSISAAAVFLFSALSASTADAYVTDAMIEGAKQCTRHLSRYEREYGIPTHLLSAIATTESGRYHDGLKIRVPWPWTINAEGKGYFFDSKEEAIGMVKKLRARGVQSIDVGCMQVNLYYHPEAFASLDQAFEPENNIAYSASFLRGLYEEGKSWKKAASDYHSKTPTYGNKYVGMVYNSWYQIIDKLHAAKMQVPATAVAAMDAMKKDVAAMPAMPPGPIASTPVQSAAAPLTTAPMFKLTRPNDKAAKSQSTAKAYSSPRMNSIRVTRNDSVVSRENGIIVVRPEIKVVDSAAPAANSVSFVQNAALTVAQAKPDTSAPDPKVMRVVPVGNSPVNTVSHKNEPRFIFND